MEKSGTEIQGLVNIDKGQLQNHLDAMVRGTVEDTLNMLLDA